jgi:RNA 3'-terminal phosphate cyclase (ATP)
MLSIDGSQYSGSGTIVRYSIGIAAIFKQDIKIFNIRARRSKPGLRPQHLTAVRAVADITGGTIEGGEVGAGEIVFKPGDGVGGGTFRWDIGTAGSTTMLGMTVLPAAFRVRDTLRCIVTGGLIQDFAPSYFHMRHVLAPVLHQMGISLRLKMVRPGYVPTGEGILEIEIDPVRKPIKPLSLCDQGRVESIDGIAFSSHLKDREVSKRMADVCRKVLSKKGYTVNLREEYDATAQQPGAALAVYARTGTRCIIGADRAGAPGRRSESIGRFVARSLIEDLDSGATVDRYCADQLILYAALADGVTEYRIPFMTDHVETNLWLVRELIGCSVEVNHNIVRIEGIGFKPHPSD